MAMALVAGSLIAVDSSAFGLLRSAIDSVSVDFLAEGYNYNTSLLVGQLNTTVKQIESVKNVEEAMPFVKVGDWWTITDYSTYTEYPGQGINGAYIAFIPSDSGRMLQTSKIKGTAPENGTAAIPKIVADTYKINIGDRIHLQLNRSYIEYDYSNISNPVGVWHYSNLNLSFVVSQTWTQDIAERDQFYPYGNAYDNRSVFLINEWATPVILNLASYSSVMNSSVTGFLANYSMTVQPKLFIWIDRDAVINLADIGASVRNIQFIQHRLVVASQGMLNVPDSPLATELQNLAPSLDAQKLLFLALSLPVVALGTYLSVVGVDLGVNSRRREVGMLKSRGASNRQVFASLILESIILGAIAAIVGLVLGIVASRFLLGSAVSFASGGDAASTSLTDLRISIGTVELALLFGIGLMVLGSYRPFKRVSKTDVAEALHHYSASTTQVEYKPRGDIILLSISVISILSVLMGTNWLNEVSWSWITRALAMILLLFGLIMFPVMPFFLSLAVVRLMTRGSRRLYSKLAVLVKPWTKELHYLVDKNIVRNPRRASNLGVIIALAIAFGLFISVTMESSIAAQVAQVKQEVGSDIKIDANQFGGAFGGNVNFTKLGQLDSLSGAKTVAMYYTLSVNLGSSGYYSYGATIALADIAGYKEAVRPSDFYFIHGGNGLLDDLRGQTCLVTKDFADRMSWVVGDMVSITAQSDVYVNGSYQSPTWSCFMSIIGIVKPLPGLGYSDMIADKGSVIWIPAKDFKDTFYNFGALIKVEGGADSSDVAAAALQVFRGANFSANALVMKDEIAALHTDPAFGALADFLYMEYAMSIGIMSVGVGLIIFVSVTDREHELACIMARGSSGSQMRKILMGESFSLMILGLIVGATVGVITAYLFNTITQPGSSSGPPREMVFTYVSWLLLIVSVASLVLASLIATARAGRMKLAEVLRIRGG